MARGSRHRGFLVSATLQDLLAAYRSLSDAREEIVLATIIATEGSTYRKAGARMLFARDGRRFGVLAGGSFEDELARHAARLFGTDSTAIVDMDTPGRGDTARDFLRDGGARIFLQALSSAQGYTPLALIATATEGAAVQVLITIVQSTHPMLRPGSTFLAGAGAPAGIAPEIFEELSGAARSAVDGGTPLIVNHLFAEGELEAFYAPLQPPLSLLLLGATPDAVPVARIARLLGWHVRVADARGNLFGDSEFTKAGEVLAVAAEVLAGAVHLDTVDAAVLLTRNFELDCAYLRVLAASAIPYLGLLGSHNRCRRLIDSLGDDARRLEGRVHGPVGLAIGAETPEEIALAITAEVQNEYRKRATVAAERRAAQAALTGKVHALLLAAGGSRRFGSFKQLLEFRGESLLRRAARLSSELLEGRVVVVHGPKPAKCQRELSGIDVAHAVNASWENGVATSLRAGVRALPDDCAAVLVLLCDQPLIGADQVRALLRAWAAAPERIAASAYADTLGVPAVFPRQYFPQILQLTGDRGAKSIIEANAANVTAVAIPEACLDIDTQEDYASMLKHSQEPDR
jgi:xanthine/CO dehydrogenase XdhC/CoxF family maturation factor/2-phospho-L-lactate guanylyltransferase (CobY/MobA/RfbA family)